MEGRIKPVAGSTRASRQTETVAHFHLAAALARLGELNEVRAVVQTGFTLDPSFTVRRLRTTIAWSDNPAFLPGRERVIEGMRMARVPEG